MAKSLGDMIVRIVGDNKEFDAGIDKSEKKFNNFAKSAAKIGKNLTKFVTVPLIGMAAAAVKFAVDAEETAAKFGTAFRSIRGTADATAENLAKNFGLSTTQAQRLLAGNGDLLKGFGATESQALDLSNQVQELAVDLASYNNVAGGADRASGALTSALLGEREALKSLGIVVNEEVIQTILLKNGQSELEGQALLLAKAQATLQAATEQSQDAIGDFARTSGSTANQMRILKADIGNIAVQFGRALLPAVNQILSKVRNFAQAISELSDGQRKAIVVALGLAAAIGPLLIAMRALVATVHALNVATKFLAANPIVAVVAGLAALVSGIILVISKYKAMRTEQALLGDGMDDLAEKVDNTTKEVDDLNEAFKRSPVWRAERQRAIDSQIESTKNLIADQQRLVDSYKNDLIVAENVQENRDREILQLEDLKTKLGELIAAREAFIAGTHGLGIGVLVDEAAAKISNLTKLFNEQGISEIDLLERKLEIRLDLLDSIQEGVEAGEIEADTAVTIINDQIADTERYIERIEELREANKKVASEGKQHGITQAKIGKLALQDKKDQIAAAKEAAAAAEKAAEDADEATRARFMDLGKSELELAKQRIEEERVAFIAAGVDRVDANEWAIGEIAKAEKAAAAAGEATRAQFRDLGKTDLELAIDNILAQRDAFIAAKADEVAVTSWTYRELAKAREAAEAEDKKKKAAAFRERVQRWTNYGAAVVQIISAIGAYSEAKKERELRLLDEQQQAEIDAAGLTEATAVESAQTQLDAAIEAGDEKAETELERRQEREQGIADELAAATAAGDTIAAADLAHELERIQGIENELAASIAADQAETVAELEEAVAREEIIEEFDKKRAEVEKAAAMRAWKIQMANAVAGGAMAVINGLMTQPFVPVGLAMGVLAGILAAVQIATVKQAKPFAEGGIVAPTPGGTLGRLAEAGQPEVVFPLDQLESFLGQRPGLEGGGAGDIRLVVNMDSKPILEQIFPATRNRTVLIDARAVT